MENPQSNKLEQAGSGRSPEMVAWFRRTISASRRTNGAATSSCKQAAANGYTQQVAMVATLAEVDGAGTKSQGLCFEGRADLVSCAQMPWCPRAQCHHAKSWQLPTHLGANEAVVAEHDNLAPHILAGVVEQLQQQAGAQRCASLPWRGSPVTRLCPRVIAAAVS